MEAFICVIKSIAVLSIFYTVYFFFLRKETLFTGKRLYFLAGIVASIILPFVRFTIPIYSEQSDLLALSEVLPLQNMTQTISIEVPFDWWFVLYAVYGIGLIVFIVRFAIQLHSLKMMLKNCPVSKQGKYLFLETSEKISPFSFFNYIVFNPSQHTKEELAMILQHEKVHASQWHSIDLIVANLICAIQWINPMSWLYKKSLEENLEFIADRETVAQVFSKKQYQLALVKNSLPIRASLLTTQFYQSVMKKRIIFLNKSASQKHNVWKFSFVLPFLCIFLWSFNVKEEIHVAMLESSFGEVVEVFTILPTTTDQELNLIEAHFDGDHTSVMIKISNRGRDENGLINAFEFKTKFKAQNRFYRRFSINGDASVPYKGHTLQSSNGIINIAEIGPNATKVKITENNLKITAPDFPVIEGK